MDSAKALGRRLLPVLLLLAAGAAAPPAPPPPSFAALVERARRGIVEVSPAELKARLASPRPPLLVDVREDSEWAQGRLPGAVHMSRGTLERRLEAAAPDAETEVVLYCASGARSALAAESLGRMGYRRVSSLAGGYKAWTRAGFPVVKEAPGGG